MNCNAAVGAVLTITRKAFQSLIGILMNCNTGRIGMPQKPVNEKSVSIPNRDFDELQFLHSTVVPYRLNVSIPNRDFDELQFLCPPVDLALLVVSIPNRDFDELQWGDFVFA